MLLDTLNLEKGAELKLAVAFLSVLFLFVAPWFAQKLLRISKRANFTKKRRLWIAGELILASSVATTFIAMAASVLIGAGIIFPWLLEIGPRDVSLDDPLTSRLLLYWVGVISLGWFVFRSVGINSTRDVHRHVKEIQDDLKQGKHNRNSMKQEKVRPPTHREEGDMRKS